ncbi:mRNA interferase RelE/StbE [Haloactinospora alba]|uniref:mRNA interferase RelE/StbE n=1 Tax=Haloactinospora alba TaxID=405555 RepID=A0A543NG08_9ACTN|nr:mRNA interferase RelE/StbE [Haloactinospora alba]
MDGYRIEYDRAAIRDLAGISEQRVRQAVSDAIDRLAREPRPDRCCKMQGRSNAWRIPVRTVGGPYRVIYTVDDAERRVVIMIVGHRRQVYR